MMPNRNGPANHTQAFDGFELADRRPTSFPPRRANDGLPHIRFRHWRKFRRSIRICCPPAFAAGRSTSRNASKSLRITRRQP